MAVNSEEKDAKICGSTSNGFEYEIDPEKMDDMELLDDLISIDKGDVDPLPSVMQKILGDEQKKKLYEYCRDKKTGRVSATKVLGSFKEILENAGIKNS
jgi:hypothetical protein